MEYALQFQVITECLASRLNNDTLPIPDAPPVARRALQLARDSAAPRLEDLVELLQAEPHLEAQVLRAANSPLFCSGGTVLTLPQAVQSLGLRAAADLAMALSLNANLFYAPGYQHCINAQLYRSLLCGLWAREVARIRRRGLEAAFLTGILRDIGRPVAIQAVLEAALRHRLHLSYDKVLTLADRFEVQVTRKVLRHWQIPVVVRDVAEHFAAYAEAGAARDQTMVTVAGARLAAHSQSVKNRTAHKSTLLADPVFGELNLPAKTVEQLLERTPLVVDTAERLLGY